MLSPRKFGFALRVLLVLSIVCGFLLYRLLRKKRGQAELLEKFRDRPQRSPEEFAREFFGDSDQKAKLAAQLMHLLVKNVPIQIDLMEPEDDFVADWKIPEFDKLALGEFFLDAEEELQIELPTKPEEKLRTFQAVQDYVLSKLSEEE